MSAKDVVDENYPLYERYRAPVITVKGDVGVSVGMEVIPAFCEIDKNTPPLLDYSDEFEFEPNKPLPPSAISWPSGDGRGNDLKGVRSFFTQPNLKTYGPFPDFFKVRCAFLFSSFFNLLFLRHLACFQCASLPCLVFILTLFLFCFVYCLCCAEVVRRLIHFIMPICNYAMNSV